MKNTMRFLICALMFNAQTSFAWDECESGAVSDIPTVIKRMESWGGDSCGKMLIVVYSKNVKQALSKAQELIESDKDAPVKIQFWHTNPARKCGFIYGDEQSIPDSDAIDKRLKALKALKKYASKVDFRFTEPSEGNRENNFEITGTKLSKKEKRKLCLE